MFVIGAEAAGVAIIEARKPGEGFPGSGVADFSIGEGEQAAVGTEGSVVAGSVEGLIPWFTGFEIPDTGFVGASHEEKLSVRAEFAGLVF